MMTFLHSSSYRDLYSMLSESRKKRLDIPPKISAGKYNEIHFAISYVRDFLVSLYKTKQKTFVCKLSEPQMLSCHAGKETIVRQGDK